MARREEQERADAVGVWLGLVSALVVAMILVGGATRLTDSGLSITEWNFAKQVVPPLTEAGWQAEFALYRETAEYQLQNRGMSLAAFQTIYAWEWGHRFLGKVIGLVYAAGFFFFWARGALKGRLAAALALFGLGGLQGYVGWWMVESGLAGRLDVAPERLATHLGLAFLILAGTFWLCLSCFAPGRGRLGAAPFSLLTLGLLYAQILTGALVAGADAGRAFPEWPTIGGVLVPPVVADGFSSWAEYAHDYAALQFMHRTLGYVAAAAALGVGVLASTQGAPRLGGALVALALLQPLLGIVTVLTAAPLAPSLLHQAGGVALWLAATAVTRCQVVSGYRIAKAPSHKAIDASGSLV